MAIKVTGIDELSVTLEGLALADLTGTLAKCGAVVERRAKQKCPKDLGELARSIQFEVDGDTCTIFTPLEYAPYVEYGTGLFAEQGGRKKVPWRYQKANGEWYTTKGQHPQPYLRPAFTEAQGEIITLLEGGLLK